MANREALRQLQSRLAERLKAARTETRQISWLAVECGGHGLLVPLPTAGEIFPAGTLLAVPHTQPWFLGVANLRGQLHGVVDLAAFLGLRLPLARDALRDQARLLAFNPKLGSHSAVLVDRLAGLRNLEAFSSSSQASEGAPGYFGSGYTDANGAYWQEINLQALSQQPNFLSISA